MTDYLIGVAVTAAIGALAGVVMYHTAKRRAERVFAEVMEKAQRRVSAQPPPVSADVPRDQPVPTA